MADPVCDSQASGAEITQMLEAIEHGDARAADRLLPLVYDRLRQLAAYQLSMESPGQTLQATALVHEAYVQLVGQQDAKWHGRSHFLAVAAEAMRRILIDKARRKRRVKHGGQMQRVELRAGDIGTCVPVEELLALDEALHQLAEEDPQKAKLVELRFFGGLTLPQAAHSMGISRATASRYWTYARAWLYAKMGGQHFGE